MKLKEQTKDNLTLDSNLSCLQHCVSAKGRHLKLAHMGIKGYGLTSNNSKFSSMCLVDFTALGVKALVILLSNWLKLCVSPIWREGRVQGLGDALLIDFHDRTF